MPVTWWFEYKKACHTSLWHPTLSQISPNDLDPNPLSHERVLDLGTVVIYLTGTSSA